MQEPVGIQISRGNAERLDTLTFEVREIKHLLKGESGAPGVLERLTAMEVIMLGKDKPTEGIVYKVGFMWRAHVIVVALFSSAVTLLLEHVFKLIFH